MGIKKLVIGEVIKLTGNWLADCLTAKKQAEPLRGEAEGILNELKKDYGNGVSTRIIIQNDTAASLSLVHQHSYHGGPYSESPFPNEIGPGQDGLALHVHSSGAAVGSMGCAVYRVKKEDKSEVDVFLGWDTPWGSSQNRVYVEVRDTGHWPKVGSWKLMKTLIDDKGDYASSNHEHGIKINASIAKGTTSLADFVVDIS